MFLRTVLGLLATVVVHFKQAAVFSIKAGLRKQVYMLSAQQQITLQVDTNTTPHEH